VTITGQEVRVKVWKAEAFGNVPLYLLDTDLPNNPASWTTGQLYGWFGEERVAQEIVLGIGGVRALRDLGIEVDLYHFNEGHALLAGFDPDPRGRWRAGMSYEDALGGPASGSCSPLTPPSWPGNETPPGGPAPVPRRGQRAHPTSSSSPSAGTRST
jgi:glycogen phosphorylase